VYAVWFNMYPGDARSKWPSSLLTDSRVEHLWDEQRVVGLTYLMQLPTIVDRRAPGTLQPTADVMWDAFFVYGPGERWENMPPPPVSWGYPIMVTREQLAESADALLPK
jgi:hypothetical protein